MNAEALLFILITAIGGKVDSADLEVAHSFTQGRSCEVNDGKCVARYIYEGRAVVKAAKKARKEVE